MRKYRKKNKIIRYLTVFKRRLKSLNRKKILHWFRANLKGHPFILGLLLFIWLKEILLWAGLTRWNIKGISTFHIFLFISWLALVILSNLLRDKQKVKWYFKKRFVFIMLLFFPPLGLVFLWAGSQFKRATKVTFSIIFGSLFIISTINYNKKYEIFLSKSPLERTIEIITSQKKKIFLKMLDKDVLSDLKLTMLTKRAKVKLAVSDVAKRCSQAVVSIKTKDRVGNEIGMGSGFVISQNGLIVTNFHVMASAYQAEIKIGEEVFKDASLVKAIKNFDIAILKIDAKNLLSLPIGDSDSLVTGQFVIALGNPGGFERTVSSGIISALRSKGEIKLIQMTAPVSPGSSGGPVINEYGEVVGITTLASIFMAQNLNFAIPINYLNKIIKKQ